MSEGGGDSLDGGAGEEAEDLGHGSQACASADGACQDHITCGGFDNFMVARLVDRVNSEQVREFAKRISLDAEVRTDAFLACGFWANRIGMKPKSPRPKKWMNGFRRCISSSATSRVFWRELFMGHCIDTCRYILTSLFSVSIAGSGNLNCRTGYCKLPLIM